MESKFQISLARLFHLNEDLPSMTINAIAEDNFGNIWLGMLAGVASFDSNELQ
jgi:ligand-binding sensor domain-containing protein